MKSSVGVANAIIFCLLVCSANPVQGDTLFKKNRRIAIGWVRSTDKGVIYWEDCEKNTFTQYKQPPYWYRSEDNCKIKGSGPWGQNGYRPQIVPPAFSVVLSFLKGLFHLPGRDEPLTLTVRPSKIEKGESASLSWSSSYDVYLDIKPDIGTVVARTGGISVTPERSTRYVLTARGPGGKATAKVRLIVTRAQK